MVTCEGGLWSHVGWVQTSPLCCENLGSLLLAGAHVPDGRVGSGPSLPGVDGLWISESPTHQVYVHSEHGLLGIHRELKVSTRQAQGSQQLPGVCVCEVIA